tara:strand:+ start:158 stop:424 length:267 start_codon:yes stop_codon:yes gene_type:complete
MWFVKYIIDSGPFAVAKEKAHTFGYNLYLSHAVAICAKQLKQAEQEHQEALCRGDEDLINQKKLELQTYRSSLLLTAYMLDEVDEIST